MKHLLAAFTLSVLGISSADAENDSGPYIGAGVGQFNIEVDDFAEESFDSDDTSFKIFAGWRILPFLALELDYIDLGGPKDDIGGRTIEADVSGIAPYVIGTIPLGPLELFAKVGYYFYDFEIKSEDIEDRLDESDEDLVYGAGVGLTLFEHLHARVEYEIIDVSDVDDANALWLSAAWRF